MRSQEDEKFDRDWYLADKFDPPDELIEILRYSIPETLDGPFTTDEQSHLRNLGNRDCKSFSWVLTIVLIENAKDVYLNLPPLLFAILYDTITTMSSPTPESPWTISRLSPSLSSLAPVYLSPTPSIPFSHLPPIKQIRIAVYRRVLTYPLYRNLTLADKVWAETIRCVSMGKRAIIRLLTMARTMFMDGGDWSVYSRIIWEDYIIWCQSSKDRVWTVLAEEMGKVEIALEEFGFGLEDIERME
jgi:protein SHQ1